MNPATTEPQPQTAAPPAVATVAVPFEPRNFWAWVAHQFFFRIGWQFKLESTMVAGIISFLVPGDSSARVVGMLQSARTVTHHSASFAAAPWVANSREKRGPLLMCWVSAIASWAVLTAFLWTPAARENRTLMLWVFCASYLAFHTLLGGQRIASGTLLGKIIPAEYRGRALAAGMLWSGVVNVALLLLVARVVRDGFPEPLNFALTFTICIAIFVLSAVALLWVRETPSAPERRSRNPLHTMAAGLALANGNRNLRLLIGLNVMMAIGFGAMPLYTLYWRQLGTLTPERLMYATVLQVAVQSISAAWFGRVADRHGNRRVVRLLLWAEGAAPLAAAAAGLWFGDDWLAFLSVYVLIGIRFPLFQLLVNYLLEIVAPDDHATALGMVTLVSLFSAPVPWAMGEMMSAVGAAPIFAIAATAVAAGMLMALLMDEPRQLTAGDSAPP